MSPGPHGRDDPPRGPRRTSADPEHRVHPPESWRSRLHEVIFEADTLLGRAFDVVLLVLILVSVVAVMLESVTSIRARHGPALLAAEWVITILFTVEYVLRIVCVGRPLRYATSFFGIVDLLSILPTYVSLLVSGAQTLIVIRTLRLLRTFRVLKLARFVGEASVLRAALRASLHKVTVFLLAVLSVVVIVGATMYLIEGEEHGFDNIPESIYWSVVTVTTVGYGDIAPQTVPGKLLASALMFLGYGVLAVPTGIVTVEFAQARFTGTNTQACPQCSFAGHDDDARFCKRCGSPL